MKITRSNFLKWSAGAALSLAATKAATQPKAAKPFKFSDVNMPSATVPIPQFVEVEINGVKHKLQCL
jgi:hypothetical protein